ncbi:hypothetical protein Dimus_029024 [Dionaea muscipula]
MQWRSLCACMHVYMPRKRARVIASEQAPMADMVATASPSERYRKPASSFLFGSPKLFTAFASKIVSENDPVMSPTSILDSKPFSALKGPYWSESNSPKSPTEASSDSNKRHCYKYDSRGLGLAIVDEKLDPNLTKQQSRMVLFGSQLKIHIPVTSFPVESTKSPVEFGIKTKNSQLGYIPSPHGKKCSFESPGTPYSTQVLQGCLSVSDMELSEDYTCIISRGPVPKTTHIFDNCIVESCFDGVGCTATRENGFSSYQPVSYPSDSFLSFCFTCKKQLGQGKDIYIYRGEKAFCSKECRYQEMMMEERLVDV